MPLWCVSVDFQSWFLRRSWQTITQLLMLMLVFQNGKYESIHSDHWAVQELIPLHPRSTAFVLGWIDVWHPGSLALSLALQFHPARLGAQEIVIEKAFNNLTTCFYVFTFGHFCAFLKLQTLIAFCKLSDASWITFLACRSCSAVVWPG